MADIEVVIFSGGKEIKRIRRPVRYKDRKPFVTYQGKSWILANGNEINLDGLDGINPVNPDGKPAVTSSKEKVISALLGFLRGEKKGTAKRAERESDSSRKTNQEKQSNVRTNGAFCDSEKFFEEPAWDSGQNKVIQYQADGRILVNAGPGTGKTAVACARVAWLIDHGNLEPGRIWLISFTRTAVREVKDRIKSYLRNGSAAHEVKIATIDSHAWAIHSGFDGKAKLLGSYEENIARLLELVKSHGGVGEYLESVEHVIIDEAQDIVGLRADLILEIMKRLSGDCGITVFSDDAQAIYGFAVDDDRTGSGSLQLTIAERIRKLDRLKFSELEIEIVHRTESRSLKRIFTELRKDVLKSSGDPKAKLDGVKRKITELADERIKVADEAELSQFESCFILYRRRADVLQRSSFFGTEPHRIRMSGLPACIHPWVGACLSEFTKAEISAGEFSRLWEIRVNGTLLGETFDRERAWAQLWRVAGNSEKTLSMKTLRQRLGRGSAPAEFCNAEVGARGPILGTIHACKGREADRVYLMLPINTGQNSDNDEEARVVFVGATRAREILLVGNGFRQYSERLEGSGRVYIVRTQDRKPRAQFEIGIEEDLRASGIAGKRYFRAEDVLLAQKKMIEFAGIITPAHAESHHEGEHEYRLRANGADQILAVLSERVGSDLFDIGRRIQSEIRGRKRRPPDSLNHLRIFGIRTVVLPPDSPECALLHEPWSGSGIMLAPVISGFTTAHFPYY